LTNYEVKPQADTPASRQTHLSPEGRKESLFYTLSRPLSLNPVLIGEEEKRVILHSLSPTW